MPGRGWNEYKTGGTVCGIKLPEALQDGSRLPEPLFTPSTKSQDGTHDQNISFAAVENAVGADAAKELRRLTLAIYEKGERACGVARTDSGGHEV